MANFKNTIMDANLAAGIPIQDRPWKVWMSNNPSTSAVLTNLYELLYNDKDELFYNDEEINPGKPLKGRNLGHSILLYNTSLYTNSGSLQAESPISLYWEQGIDINIPLIDKRSKPRKVINKINGTLYQFLLPEKQAVLFTKNTLDFYKSTAEDGTDWRAYSDKLITDDLYQLLVGPAVGDRAPSAIESSALMLTSPDPVFEASLVLETSKTSFTQAFLNLYSTSAVTNAITTLNIINTSLKRLAISCDKEIFNSNTEFLEWVKSEPVLAKDILSHCFIWIRAPFCADYVDPKDFNQNLNQDSNVIHKNIYLSESFGNFNRYSEVLGDDLTLGKTRGYVPSNAPLKDFISNKLIPKEKSELLEVMNYLIEDSEKDNSRIGSVLSEPVKDNASTSTLEDKLTPPQFFDPETTYATDEQKKALGRVPTIIPKNGNIITDGRIISPTIDELWYMVKKLISGRPADTTIPTDDFGYLKGTEAQENDKDTTLSELKLENNYKFKYGDNEQKTDKYGDPVTFDYDYDDYNHCIGINVSEFFSQPNETNFVDYEDILKIEALLKTFKNTSEDEFVPTEYKNIEITNTEDHKGTKNWAQRETPLSLRELEGRILSNKYNIVKAYTDLVNTTAKAGGLGKAVVIDDDIPSADGTLYYLHKNFNFSNEKPNTYFNQSGDGTFEKGTDIQVDDKVTSGLKNYDGTSRASKKALLVRDYGTAKTLADTTDKYYGAEVYLAADGTWRSIHEHIRLPILRSEY